MDTIREFSIQMRRVKAIGYGLKHPILLKKSIRNSISYMYSEGMLRKGSLNKISPESIIQKGTEVKLLDFLVRNGNVSSLELLVIALLISAQQPLNLLEIGTFDGNTTLQMALNCPGEACVHTIDLPDSEIQTAAPMLEDDLKFMKDKKKQKRKFIDSPVETKIIQHFGDSTIYDFNKFTENGPIDFCFIDGGHSYECVKRDSAKTLEIISKQAIVLWHDFSPNCPGVYHWLLELGKEQSLVHIEGTNLVALFP